MTPAFSQEARSGGICCCCLLLPGPANTIFDVVNSIPSKAQLQKFVLLIANFKIYKRACAKYWFYIRPINFTCCQIISDI